MHRYHRHKNKYVAGDYKVRCDVSGLTVMNSKTMITWDNKKVAVSEWDPKHPQLILHPRQDKISVDNPRPTPELDSELPFGEGKAEDL